MLRDLPNPLIAPRGQARGTVAARVCLAGVILAGMTLAGCGDAESAQGRPAGPGAAVNVTVAPVTTTTAQRGVDTVGTLFGDEETTISAKVSGRIVAIYHDVGDRVAPGTPLAQIETRDYELARAQKELAVRESLSKLGLSEFPESGLDTDTIPTVSKARLAAENAEGRFGRGKQLFDQQPPRLSEQEFADLQTAWEVAQNEYQVQVLQAQSTLAEARSRQAELDQTDQQLADTVVRAPAAAPAPTQPGADDPSREYAIAERIASVGEFVANGAPLFRLIDDNPIKLRANVPERFVPVVRVGQSVRVSIEAFPEPFIGTVSRVNPQIDPVNRNFRIEALIDNPDRLLRPGAFARATVLTRVEDDVVFIPQSALVTFAGVNRVYVLEDGKAAERILTLGQRRETDVEVLDGLKPGEMLVVQGAANLIAGTPLNPSSRTADAD